MPFKKKYDKDMEDELASAYTSANSDEERVEIIERYVSLWGKPTRSIIAKLSKMKIYKPKERISKLTGEIPRTKDQLVKDLAIQMRCRLEELLGLEKAPKLVILKILKEYIKKGP